MEGPLVVGIAGGVIVFAATFLSFRLLSPDRYNVGKDTTFDGNLPGLRRMIVTKAASR
jgi:hypothetical protein